MNKKIRYKRLKYIPYYLFLIISIILSFVDVDNFVPIMVFAIITAMPVFIKPWEKTNKQLHNIVEELKFVFYFSIFFIYFGYFFALFYKSDSEIITSGVALAIIAGTYFFVMLGIFVYWSFSTMMF